MQVCLIFNPVARGDKARHLRKHLDEFGATCTLKPTAKAGDARPLAAQAVREGFDIIVAAGGDGTLNEVLNGISDVPDGFTRVRLGVLPLGTVNVFAREVKIPFAINAAWQVICRAREMSIDVPVAEFSNAGKTERRCFIQMAGAGFDSRAVELVNWELKKKIGPLAYVAAGLKAIREKQPLINVVADDKSFSGEWVVVGNGRFYGGSYTLFPGASLEDGLLETCIFPKVSFGQILRAGVGFPIGCLHRFCRVGQLQSRSLTLSSRQRVPLELDGENVGELPAKITLLPRVLRVLVP